MNLQTQTLDQLKRAMAVKVALTSKGYKATVKADTPDEAVTLAVKAHGMLMDLKARQESPVDKDRGDYPVLILAEAEQCGWCGGTGSTYDLTHNPNHAEFGPAPCGACCGTGITNGGYLLRHGGGDATPWTPQAQQLANDWTVQIDLEKNSKGIGWDVEVKAYPLEAAVALIDYTEARLREAFAINETA